MKTYTIIAGVNGTGKSSLTGVLKNRMSDLGRIIDVDRLAAERGGRIAGGREAIRLEDEFIGSGLSFTQETTLSGVRTLKTIRRARDEGYVVRLFYVAVSSAEESLQRIRNRVKKGGHDIPEEDVRRRFGERFESLSRVLDYCDEVTFFDNENGFADVGEYKNGELIRHGEYFPEWLRELEEYLRNRGGASPQ